MSSTLCICRALLRLREKNLLKTIILQKSFHGFVVREKKMTGCVLRFPPPVDSSVLIELNC